MIFPINSYSLDLAYLPLNGLMHFLESCDSNHMFKSQSGVIPGVSVSLEPEYHELYVL